MLADIVNNTNLNSEGSMSKLSQFLIAYRHSHNITQEKMAKILKMARGNYSKIELDMYLLPRNKLKLLYRSLNEDEKTDLQIALKEDMTTKFIGELSELLDDLNGV